MKSKISTPKKILSYLEKNQSATPADLSQWLGMTKANITYHLRKLREQQLIEPSPQPSQTNPGRPALRYHLSQKARQNNFLELCDVLLSQMSKDQTNVLSIFERMGEILGEKLNQNGLPHQRLNRLVRQLNQRGYQASWEAHRLGPQISFKSCPYSPLVKSNPRLCQMDRTLLCAALKGNAKQVELIDFSTEISGICRFEISMEYP